MPEPALDRLAELTARVIGVPTALVSLVDREHQAFPGATGLPEPWQTRRETPLSHSFCQHVVIGAEPLVVSDAREDPRVAANLAIEDLGVMAYAGMPLTNRAGDVVGSLCAIDSVVRDWTDAQLANLRDLAAACSSELQLREAIAMAHEESLRTQTLVESMPVGLIAFDESGEITEANAEAARTVQLEVEDLVGHNLWELFPATVGSDFERICERVRTTGVTEVFEYFYPEPLSCWYENRVQLTSRGLSVFFTDVSERHEIHALLQQTAEHDRSVAQTLQQALLTALPTVDGAQLAVRYLTAEGTDQVGGDWYDAIRQPSGSLAVSIGDVCGHGIESAAAMGQLRAMLRAFVWADEGTVAQTLSRLDHAAHGHGDTPITTLISGRIVGLDTAAGAQFVWSNAGHVPPLLLLPDGTVTRIEAAPELMLGVRAETPRSDHVHDLPPGSTLVLYTDGLVESRSEPLDAGIDRLADSLARHHARSLDELLDRTLDDLRSDQQDDDIAILAVRVGPGRS